MTVITRADAHVSVVVDGVDRGVWDEMEGGNTSGNAGRYRPSGGKQQALKGRKSTEPVTVRTGFDPVVHNKQWYRDRIGKGMSVTVRARDQDNNPTGEIDTYTGLLDEVNSFTTETDTDDVAMLELVMASNEK